MSRRRIAYLTLQATREGQAAHAHVHEIIAGLEDLGWSVDLYEPAYHGRTRPSIIARLVELRRVQRELARHLGDYDAVYLRGHPLAVTTSRRAAAARVPSVVECNGPTEDFFTAWPAARRMRFLIERWQRRQYQLAGAVVAVTTDLAHWVEEQTGRIDAVVIPNGANTDMFRPGTEPLANLPRRYAIFFGALAAWQGVPTLLAAACEPSWPAGVSLVIAGDGALSSLVMAAAESDGVTVYAGSIPYADMPNAVGNALVSISPQIPLKHGRSAVSPLKLFESMAAGVPVVVTDLPGLADTVRTAQCGIVVPPNDPRALANAVASLVLHPAEACSMGAKGRDAAVSQHSWRVRAEETSHVLESLIPQM